MVSDLNETLVAEWIAGEAVANGIFEHTPEGYVFYGDTNDYYVEVKAFRVKRLTEPAIALAYD